MIGRLVAHLRPLGFEPLLTSGPHDETWTVEALLRRRSWRTNRGVAVVRVESLGHPGALARRIKATLGHRLGYAPGRYPLGLQLVLVGEGLLEQAGGLERFLDRFDTQTVVLQSIHVVDTKSGECISVRTWGQVVTGPYIDAIERALGEDRRANVSRDSG